MRLSAMLLMMSVFSALLLLNVIREVEAIEFVKIGPIFPDYLPIFLTNQPGAKLQLSQPGLNYAARVAVDILTNNIQNKKIPDQSGSVSFLGKVEYSITDVTIKGFTKPSSTVIVNTGSGVTWTLANAGISATGGWSYRKKIVFFTLKDSGSFGITISGASASLTVTLGKDSNGRPTITVLGCSCTISNLDVKFKGGASWIYNLFSGFIEKPIKTALQNVVCDEATKIINNNGAQQLATLQTSVALRSGFIIDYRLLEKPLFASGYIQTSHKGEVFHTEDVSEAPFSARIIPTQTPSRMLTVSVSEYVVNTLGHVLHKRGILSYTLTRDVVPDNFKNFFATSCPSEPCFGTLFPEVASSNPNSFVELNMRTSTRPTLTISATGSAIGSIQGQVDVGVRNRDNTVRNLLSLGVSVKFTVAAGMRGNYLIATVINFSPTITVYNSTINNIPQQNLNQLLEGASKEWIIPKLNEVGQQGFAIPSIAKVTLVGPSLTFIDGAVVISTDVNYTP